MRSPDRSDASSRKGRVGGIIHTYQRYDPHNLPSPTAAPCDVISPAFEHLLAYGSIGELTEEELARAIRLDPSQIAGLGPSLESLRQMLLERKRKILETYETLSVQRTAGERYHELGDAVKPPKTLREAFRRAYQEEQIGELEQLWYRAGGEKSTLAVQLLRLVGRLEDKYQIDELAARYDFTGRTPLTIAEALRVKEELQKIDELLKQLEEAAQTAQIALIDRDMLSEFAEPSDVEQLSALQQQIQNLLREIAQRQGLEHTQRGYQLHPKAYRLFQGKLLERIFSNLQASRSGRHQGPVVGEGAVELQQTKPYEFGDSVTQMDIPASLTNAMIRGGARLPVPLTPDDIEIHRTRNTPKCATAVIMDMSGSMGRGGLYIEVKRMALALDGLIRGQYPGDFLQFFEIYSFAKPLRRGEVATLMPKPVTLWDPWVRLKADMSRPDISETMVPPHFTNIQHGLHLACKCLSAQDTPNRQIILITDGLPTAHFEGEMLYLLYPPDEATESATLREGRRCHRQGITINVFLLPNWSQSRKDVQFAHRLAETTTGRVFFTAGRDLDRYVVWDYVNRRRSIIC